LGRGYADKDVTSMVPTHKLLILAAFALPVALPAASCRMPTTRLSKDPAVGGIYDPETADAVAERFPATKAFNDRYRTTLAEPVSVVAWDGMHSESDVFYATNRVPQVTAAGAAFGADWGQELAFGIARVSLPRAKRGTAADGPKLPSRATPLADADFFASLREIVARAPEHDVLLFVHGFNVDFPSSVARGAQLGIDIPFNGAIVAYDWPSQGGIRNYGTDEEVVARSIEPFARFLDSLDRGLPAETKIHIVVHSMGNRLVLGALNRLPERFREPPRFANVILAAPDVGVEDFATLAPGVAAVAKRVTLYASDSDTALIASKGRNQQQRIGDVVPPVVVPGIETIDASAIETSLMGHSYYGSNTGALADLFAVIKEDRGAAKRFWLASKTDDNGQWWVFQSQPEEIHVAWTFKHLAAGKAAGDRPTELGPAQTAARP
jgi:esterase/lipase superfamily enzyme